MQQSQSLKTISLFLRNNKRLRNLPDKAPVMTRASLGHHPLYNSLQCPHTSPTILQLCRISNPRRTVTMDPNHRHFRSEAGPIRHDHIRHTKHSHPKHLLLTIPMVASQQIVTPLLLQITTNTTNMHRQ
jgi:hypothetical protein